MKKTGRAKELTLPQLLKELKRSKRRLEDIPLAVLRDAQKRGFPDMRSIFLPPPIIRQSLRQPLLRDLLVTRVGYCSRAAGHYIPRPEGSLDHIFLYCVGGKGWLRMAGRQWDVPPGKAVFLPCGMPHIYGADMVDPWSNYWIHFTGRQAVDYFEALHVKAEQPLLSLPRTEEFLSALRTIETHMTYAHTRPNLIAASTALARFLSLIQLRQSAREEQGRTTDESIQQTIDHMRVNLTKSIALRELAQLARMSVSRYEKIFTKHTGSSPINYFNRMKIQRVCHHLTNTDLPIKHICLEMGYNDPYYFSRVFKKMMGVSPAYFRNPTRVRTNSKI